MKIEIDTKGKRSPTSYSWRFGIGNDHAFQMHRRDVYEQAKFIHEELGIQYIRFHGIFDDDMLCYQRLSDYKPFRGVPHSFGISEINFKQVADIYDNVLSAGLKPFVELSFIPSALAKGKKTGLRYLNNITRPKNLERWAEFIKSFIRFLLQRYGKEEVESWYFEVWNEPDLAIFFKGKQKDYFRLYEVTSKAVKEVDDKLRVGGPSSSSCLWIKDFLSFCEEKSLSCDFVSTHHYPGDAFGNSFGAKDAFRIMKIASDSAKNKTDLSDTLGEMFFRPEVYKTWTKGALRKLDEKALGEAEGKPFFITEWNSMAVFASAAHDSKYSSAFIIKTCMDLDSRISGYMFWCMSDVYEEVFMLGKPFHGGFGLLNNDGIPKPNFYAFKLLSLLYPERIEVASEKDGEVEYACFADGKDYQILIWAQDHDFYKNEVNEVDVSINFVAKKVTGRFIDDGHCNPKSEWEKLGKPDLLTREQAETIKEKSKLKEEGIEFIAGGDKTSFKVKIATNDVVLISLKA